MNRSRGVALILVLMITGILGILMLQVGLSARKQVSDALVLQDRATALLGLNSRQAALEFSLLTSAWVSPDEGVADDHARSWNFRGETFSVDDAEFRIQDVAGLQVMPQPGQSQQSLGRLMERLGMEASRIESVLSQYQTLVGTRGEAFSAEDGGAPFPLQSFGELLNLTDMTEPEVALLERNATLYPAVSFNPLTAPPAVLGVRFLDVGAESVVELARRGELTREALFDIAGFAPDEFTSFYPGPALMIETVFRHRDVALRKFSTVAIQPYSADPIVLWSQHRARNSPAGDSWQE